MTAETDHVPPPNVRVLPDAATLAQAAADEAEAALCRSVEVDGVAHAMFATGNSQLGFVDQLLSPAREIPWADVIIFHMDEYVGIGPDHSASFQRWIRQRIVERVEPRAAYLIDGLAPPETECRRYAGLLREHPLHLCCLGVGENGHLAFNDPPAADFDDPEDVKVVLLDQACRRQQVGEGHFPAVQDVPERAVTVTIPALLRATRVLAVVPEKRKAQPIRDALKGPVSTACPASALRRSAQAVLFLDPDSASLLPSGLV